MAPKKVVPVTPASGASPSPAAAAGFLSARQRLLYRVGTLLGLIAVCVGGLGLLILLDDEKREHWYTHTAFADLWRGLTVKNPMFTSLALNGGAVTAFICFARLREEAKARTAAASGGKKQR